MKLRVGINIAALLLLASCASDRQTPMSPSSGVPTPQPGRELRLTLTQGENLSGPFAGRVTGPNGFECALKQSDQTQACAAAQFTNGQTITLEVALTAGSPGDRPIWRTVGCDAVTSNSCSLTMASDRSVTISIGCAICG